MNSKEFTRHYKRNILRELPHSWLNVGIYIDRMTLSNISKNTKIINSHLEELADKFVTFIGLLDEEVKRRKVKDKRVNDIILSLKETTGKVKKFRIHVENLIPSLKEKEMEVPGERKRIEDLKNFKAAKQELKDRYTKLDYLLEEKQLKEDFKELNKIIFEIYLKTKDLIGKLKGLSNPILYSVGDSFQTFEKRNLLAQIDIYIKELRELSQKIPKLRPLSLDIRGEIQIWKNVRRNLKKTTAQNYDYLKAQLLKLLNDDKELFERLKAA